MQIKRLRRSAVARSSGTLRNSDSVLSRYDDKAELSVDSKRLRMNLATALLPHHFWKRACFSAASKSALRRAGLSPPSGDGLSFCRVSPKALGPFGRAC